MRELLRWTLRWLIKGLFRVEIKGEQADFSVERLLIIANHESLLDGMLLRLFLPIDPVFVVHGAVVRNRFFRLLLTQVDYLVVDPSCPMAMKTVIHLLESGRPVVIFPEGRITTTGSLMKIYEGPALVAAKTGATILPIRIQGGARSYFSRLSGKNPRRLFPRITLCMLPPTTLPMPQAPSAKLRRQKAGEGLRRIMQGMMFAAQPQQTLFDAFCDAVETYGRRRRLVEDLKQIEYSYNDLLKMALLLGRLVERMSAVDERLGLLLPNLAPTVGMIFGMSARRRVPALLNYSAGGDALQAACDCAEIRTIITARAFVEQAKLQDKLACLQRVQIVYLEDLRGQVSLADKLWLMAYALWFPRACKLPGSPEDAAVVLFTSGTEGRPKGVVLSHRAILANIAQIHAVIDITANDKVLNALPIFHSFGLTAGALLPILSGASLYLYPTPLHYRIIPELAYDRACTVLFGTSTFLGNYGRFAHPYDFHRLRYAVAGAEKLSDAVRQLWFEKFGLRILEGYGATETAPVLAVNTPLAYRSGSVGQFLPGIEYRLVPVPGIAVGGLLHVRGDNLMSGYLKPEQPGVLQPPASEFGAGWYETGDIVEIDEAGFVHIVGRVKRFAKIGGEMISLELVEKLAFAVAPEAMHAASSQPDPLKGEALVLFSTDPALNHAQLLAKSHVLGLPPLAVPRKIRLVETLPLLGTGKVDYVSLKKMAEDA